MELTKRQKWLIEYLRYRASRNPNEWIPAQEIVDAMDCDLTYCEGDNYRISDNPSSHNPCAAIWADKEAINADPSVDEPIMYRNYQLKLPTSKEELESCYTDDLMKRAKKMLWRLGVAIRKVRKDGQMQIEYDQGGKPTERFVRAVIRSACAEITAEGASNG